MFHWLLVGYLVVLAWFVWSLLSLVFVLFPSWLVSGFQEEEDEVAADIEEQEAMTIQKRLLAEINTTDDVFEFLVQKPKEESKQDKNIVIDKDLSEMSKKEKLQLLEKESPEFMGLVNDFRELMKDVRLHLLPVVRLLDKGTLILVLISSQEGWVFLFENTKGWDFVITHL